MESIAPMTHADIPLLLRLEALCFPESPWGRQALEDELSNPHALFLVSKDDAGQVLGYGGVWFMYDAGNITRLAVRPDHRRTGLGRRLLDRLISACIRQGMESVTLEVRAGNRPAVSLYTGAGFVSCGLRKRYYRGREDALIMTKSLKDKGED